MKRSQVRLVDAFADEPLSGIPVVVLPDGPEVSDRQLLALADELGAAGVVTPVESGVRFLGTDESRADVAGAVAGGVGLLDAGTIDPGSHTLTVSPGSGERGGHDDSGASEHAGPTDDRTYQVEVFPDRRVSVTLPTQQVRRVDLERKRSASVLNVEPDAFEGIYEELPPSSAPGFGGTVFVGMNYMEWLSKVRPEPDALDSFLAETGASRLLAFTFDTLSAECEVHARIFGRGGRERATHGGAVGACGSYLLQEGALEPDTERLSVESGYFIDRPSTVTTTCVDPPTVEGRALTVLDGTVVIPDVDDDDIIVV